MINLSGHLGSILWQLLYRERERKEGIGPHRFSSQSEVVCGGTILVSWKSLNVGAWEQKTLLLQTKHVSKACQAAECPALTLPSFNLLEITLKRWGCV